MKYINICLFEDDQYQNLYPLTFFRPIYDCLCGISKNLIKLFSNTHDVNLSLHMRKELKPLFQKEAPLLPINQLNIGSPCLFINGRVICSKSLLDEFSKCEPDKNYLFTHKGTVVAVGAAANNLNYMTEVLKGTPSNDELIINLRERSITKELSKVVIIQSSWDLIAFNEEWIQIDVKESGKQGVIKGDIKPYVSIYEEQNVYIGEHTVIEDFVVIDASKGPVYIEPHVTIQAHSRLEGPLFIGHHCQILGATIKQSSIGAYCKIGGEVSHSIFMPYSNKAHYGYVGHSYIGSWVNLGAGTTTSNLKSNYSKVRIQHDGYNVETGYQFLGAFIGDFSKTGIGTLLNTGTILGPGSTIFGNELHEKWVPAFSWGAAANYQPADINKFIETTRIVMKRRKLTLTKTAEESLRELISQKER